MIHVAEQGKPAFDGMVVFRKGNGCSRLHCDDAADAELIDTHLRVHFTFEVPFYGRQTLTRK
jgi:hypothetical protein